MFQYVCQSFVEPGNSGNELAGVFNRVFHSAVVLSKLRHVEEIMDDYVYSLACRWMYPVEDVSLALAIERLRNAHPRHQETVWIPMGNATGVISYLPFVLQVGHPTPRSVSRMLLAPYPPSPVRRLCRVGCEDGNWTLRQMNNLRMFSAAVSDVLQQLDNARRVINDHQHDVCALCEHTMHVVTGGLHSLRHKNLRELGMHVADAQYSTAQEGAHTVAISMFDVLDMCIWLVSMGCLNPPGIPVTIRRDPWSSRPHAHTSTEAMGWTNAAGTILIDATEGHLMIRTSVGWVRYSIDHDASLTRFAHPDMMDRIRHTCV